MTSEREVATNRSDGAGSSAAALAVKIPVVKRVARANNAEKERSPYDAMISQLSRTIAAANRYIVELLSQNGLTGLVPSHGDILLQLFAHEALPMAALAHAIGRDPSTVTALVKKLVKAGYVQTLKSATDKRVTEVRLTEEGRALEATVGRISEQLIDAMKQGLTESELDATVQVLQKMKANFEKASEA